jgi:hypothetical protein
VACCGGVVGRGGVVGESVGVRGVGGGGGGCGGGGVDFLP